MSSNLDDILNDALNDFDFEEDTKASIFTQSKPSTVIPTPDLGEIKATSSSSSTGPSQPSNASNSDNENGEQAEAKWVDEFLSKVMNTDHKDLQGLMKELSESMGKMGDPSNSSQASSGPSASSSESSVPLPDMPDLDMNSPEMKQTLAALQQMMKDVEEGKDSDEMLDKILEASGMSNMLQQFMSKDVLLDPFKDMEAQYVTWLKDNKDQIPVEDKERYLKQHELVKKIIKVYEEEGEKSSGIVSTLIIDMQALGDPPQGMLQEMLPGMNFGPDRKPMFPQ